MLLCDVNVLVYAYRADSGQHREMRDWLHKQLDSQSPMGFSELVLSGFLRIVTHPKVFSTPTPIEEALGFTRTLLTRPNAVPLRPGPKHWEIFTELCLQTGAKGNFTADCFHAATAIEVGCEWITTDKGYARFHGLRWRHPFDL